MDDGDPSISGGKSLGSSESPTPSLGCNFPLLSDDPADNDPWEQVKPPCVLLVVTSPEEVKLIPPGVPGRQAQLVGSLQSKLKTLTLSVSSETPMEECGSALPLKKGGRKYVCQIISTKSM